ncbi:MAG TPA: type II toxin-antitoxin system Phd/YefM family antitoxin [Anaerolineales bacterium]|nr:type II toxin-antitoxin system Phd/YefM family antitoxin [Anaerolineales bacterium]
MSKIWQLQEAKNRFSELVERTIKEGVQVVTRHGERVVVVLSYQEYERMTRPKENLADFLLNSPLAGSDLSIERDQTYPRDIGLEP